MRQDEFVELHGQGAWDRLVKPMQERGRAERDHVDGDHANIIVHAEIMKTLHLHGITNASGLLQASEAMRETVLSEATFSLT
jgi:hypothetical protein